MPKMNSYESSAKEGDETKSAIVLEGIRQARDDSGDDRQINFASKNDNHKKLKLRASPA